MLRSLYSGVSGMRGFQTKLDVIGNNIANVNTIGFKQGRVMFSDILSQTTSGVTPPEAEVQGGINARQIGLGVSIGSIDTVHTPGSAMTTYKSTDLRIDGDGFFAIKTVPDQAEPYLTRAGNFTVDAENQLVTADGMFVMSTDNEIIDLDELNDTVTSFSISQSGEIIITDAAGNSVPTNTFIAVVKVPNPDGLMKIGGNLYKPTPNSNPEEIELDGALANNPATGTGAIISGQLEMSNVDLTAEFTEMIVAQRGFQANSRIITTSDQILQEVVNLKN